MDVRLGGVALELRRNVRREELGHGELVADGRMMMMVVERKARAGYIVVT